MRPSLFRRTVRGPSAHRATAGFEHDVRALVPPMNARSRGRGLIGEIRPGAGGVDHDVSAVITNPEPVTASLTRDSTVGDADRTGRSWHCERGRRWRDRP
jgi:hypothetical protein